MEGGKGNSCMSLKAGLTASEISKPASAWVWEIRYSRVLNAYLLLL